MTESTQNIYRVIFNNKKIDMKIDTGFDPKLSSSIKRNLSITSARLKSFTSKDFVSEDLLRPATHLMGGKSKLLRSTLIFTSAAALGERQSDYIDLAVAMELLHTSSLVHDDIIDEGIKRRGMEAVNMKYGDEVALIAGNALVSKAIQIASKYGREVLLSVSETAMEMCAGELIDVYYQKSKEIPNLKEYTKIAELKSASLIAASCSVVGLHKKIKNRNSFYRFGTDLGIAFQVRDDIIDFVDSNEAKRNKSKLSKRSLPNVITTLQQEFSINRKEAITKAVELNNRYVDSAIGRIGKIEKRRNLASYAEAIKIDLV